jgi:hypothetical protein
MTPKLSVESLYGEMAEPPKSAFTFSDLVALGLVGIILAYAVWKVVAG